MISPSGTTKTVVIADDTAYVRDRFCEALASAGHRCIPVRTAAELLGRLRTESGRIDLVLLDLRLPDGRGVDLVRAIRGLDPGGLPILVFSGTLTGAADVRALAALGIGGYVNEYSAPQHILAALAPHLFPHSFNRRSGPRALVGIPVSYRIGQLVATSVTLNVGRGGVAIRTIDPLAAGTAVRLRFRLPGGRADTEAEARVVWSDGRVGMGLQFERIAASDQAALDQYVEQHFFTNRRA